MICVGLGVGLRWTAAWLSMPRVAAVGLLLVVVTLGCFTAIVLKRVFEAGHRRRQPAEWRAYPP